MPGPTAERRPELANGTVEHCPLEPTWRGRSGSLELEAGSTESPRTKLLVTRAFPSTWVRRQREKTRASALLERVHPEDRLDVQSKIDRAVQARRGCEHEYRLLFSDGSIKHIHAVLDPVTDRSGEVYEIVGTATDMTEQIRAETELRRSEAYLAEAQRISHTGCWARNPISGALFWSQEEWRIFGLDPGKTKLSYELFLQMIHPEDREKCRRNE